MKNLAVNPYSDQKSIAQGKLQALRQAMTEVASPLLNEPHEMDIFMNRRFLSTLAVIFPSFCVFSSPVEAATEIVPPLVTLTAAKPVGVLNITNDRNVAAGYNIEAFGWKQESDGKILLPPTTGIRVEPAKLELPAHGSAQVRVIAQVPAPAPGEAEKVYRIRISEQSDRKRAKTEKDVQIIASFSLPVFQKPPKVAYKGRLSTSPIIDGKLVFIVHNDGTEHTYIGQATVSGQDKVGKEVFRIKRRGWYVLAGGKLEFKASISAKDCRHSPLITIAARVLESDKTWQTTITPDRTQCGAGTVSEFPTPGLEKMPISFKPGDPMPGGLKPLSAPLK